MKKIYYGKTVYDSKEINAVASFKEYYSSIDEIKLKY